MELYVVRFEVDPEVINKNKKELYNMYQFLPNYWEKLKQLQTKTTRPMKKFKTDPVFGDLGNIVNLEKYWNYEKQKEAQQMSLF